MPDIKNRIIGHGEESLDNILFNPRNWRIHPLNQQNALKGILDEVGWVQDVIVNKRTGNLVDGHLRCQLAEREGAKTIPVVYVDLSEEEEALILSTLDPVAAMAATDKAKLDDLMASIRTDNEQVQKLMQEIAEKERLEYGKKPVEDAEPQIDKAEELRVKWGVESGQLWQLGEHRLICGDCTDKAFVDRLMGGEKAEMVFTDPPYGVAVGDKNKYLNSIAPSNRIEENLKNDTLDEAGLIILLNESFDTIIGYCKPGAAWYVAAPPGPLHVLFGLALKERGIWRQTIQWVKNNSTFSPMGVCYHWQAEPIFFGWLPNGGHRWHGGRQQTTVWNIDRPMKSPEHPTMKPIELVERAIENSSIMGELVADIFLGSGTTLIACERLGRKCRAVEISPGYVAVAIQRWVDATGGTPELLTKPTP